MTVAALPSVVSYVEDGVSTSFPVPFRFRASGDLVVERIADGMAAVLVPGVDYAVTGGATDAGGTLIRSTVSSGATLKISRRTARAQPMVYNANDRFPAKSHEEALDRAILISQEQDDQIGDVETRAVMVPIGEPSAPLPIAPIRASRLFGFDGAGRPVASPFTTEQITQLLALAYTPSLTQLAGNILFQALGSTAVARTLLAKAQEIVSVKDYGAKGDGLTDDTAAIQAALSSGAGAILFPDGQYLHRDLTVTQPYQRLRGAGAKLTRISAAATIRVAPAARGVHFDQLRIGCRTSGMAGHNVIVEAPDFRAIFCESRDCAGRAMLFRNCGGGIVITGGVMQTTGTGVDDYDVEVFDEIGGANTLYCFASEVITNQHTGGWLWRGEVGSCAMDKCEFGKLTVDTGGSVKVDQARVGGKTNVQSGFVSFDASDFNDDIQIGTNGQPNIGSVRFGPGNTMKASKTIRIADNVVESSFHLGQIVNAGAAAAIAGWNNDIWCPAIDVPIAIGAASGAPTFGDGTLIARMSSEGRRRFLSVDFTLGSASSLGGGNFFFLKAPFKARNTAIGMAQVTDAGAGFYSLIARMLANDDQIFFFPTSAGSVAAPNIASATVPFTWAAGDRLILNIDAEQVA